MSSTQATAPRLGDYLDCPTEQIEFAIARQGGATDPSKRLGEVLLDGRIISADRLQRALGAQRVDRLRSCPLFADFTRRELERVAIEFEEVTVAEGVTFIRQGNREHHLFVLASGTLEIYRETGDGERLDLGVAQAGEPVGEIGYVCGGMRTAGERLDLGVAQAGEPVGEIGYVCGGMRTASVTALSRCELLTVSFGRLRHLLDEVPQLAHAFLDIITRRLFNTTERFEQQYLRLRRAERSLERLNDFLDTTELGIGIEQLMQRLVETASGLTDAERATLFLLDAVTGELWSKVAQGAEVKEIRVPAGHGVAGWVAEHKELANIADAYLDDRFHRETDLRTGYRTRSILCAPIWSLAGEILGVVQVVNKHRDESFSAEDETLIRAFAHQAAVAVENFNLYRRMLTSHGRVTMLLDITRSLGDTLELETLIKRIVTRVPDAMRCDRCSFWVVDDAGDELWSMDSSAGEMKEIRIPVASGIAGYAATTGELVNVADAYADPRFNREVDRITGYRTRNVLCVPVVNRDGKVTGVAQCVNKNEGSFDEEDAQLAQAIASQIAVALDNARLHARAVEMHSYLENVQASIASGIVTVDETGRVVTANRAATEILPQLEDRHAEPDCRRLLGERNRTLCAMVEDALAGRQSGSAYGVQVFGTAGEARTVNTSAAPLNDGQGLFKGLVVVIEDITSEQQIKSAFSQYLAPAVIEQLLEDPDNLTLGGEQREVTVLFTDIEDFTRLTERIDPGELVRLLNEYFDGACDIVLRHGGTIDKIVGDSLHVLFNAPVDQLDHRARAVCCALDLAAFSRALQAGGTGARLGDTRIGIDTGPCVVGNFGGSARFDYTAHGDAINTAARLESANKHIGTRICVSSTTRTGCEQLRFRPIGHLLLKGKSEPTEVYEPMSDDDYSTRAREEEYRKAYELMRSRDPCARQYLGELARRYPEDRLVRFHAARLVEDEAGVVVRMVEK